MFHLIKYVMKLNRELLAKKDIGKVQFQIDTC
jgi:hypothetical protein